MLIFRQENINSFIPLAYAEYNNSLPFSGASSIPLCYVLFPVTLLHHPSSLTPYCHLFLGLPLNLVVPKFIYNTLLGILFSSILCTCPNQRNLFNPIVSVTVGFFNPCVNYFICINHEAPNSTICFAVCCFVFCRWRSLAGLANGPTGCGEAWNFCLTRSAALTKAKRRH